MDYDNVNNPFITLRNHKTEQEFTVDLSKKLPIVDNDPAMSNMKKSNNAFYSDNRAEKMRMGDDVKSLGSYSISLVDVDNIIYEYITKIINPQVVGANSEVISVPVRHASPERWNAIQTDGVYRDDKGQLQRPIIIFSRSSVAKDDSFVTFNRYLTVPFVKKYSKKNSYDKFSVLNSAHPLHEVHNVTFPDHVILTYDFNMSTEYVQQMNQLVEIFNFAEDDYWGDPARFKFRAKVDSFSNTVETASDDDRIVSTNFSLTVNAYLLPMVFNNKTNVQRGLTTRKVSWGLETTASDGDKTIGLNGKPLISNSYNELKIKKNAKLNSDKINLILNRKKPTVYLKKENSEKYDIRIWPDLENYTINIEGRNFDIAKLNNGSTFIWDHNSNEIDMTPEKKYDVTYSENDQKTIDVEVCKGYELLKIRFT